MTEQEEFEFRLRLENETKSGSAPQSEHQKQRGSTDFDWMRKIAIGGRAAFEGAMGLPMMAADAYQQGPLRRALGDPTPAPAERLQGALDKVTYKAATGDERLLADTVSGATGALAGGGPMKSAMGALTVGAGAGASGGLAREAGANPLMQFLASIAGGLGTQGAMSGTKMVGRGVRNVVDPILPGGSERAVGRLLTEVAGAKRDDLLGALGTKSDVPGLNMNAGQAAVGAGSAEFSALQKIGNEIKPTPAAALEASQKGARRSALQTIGRDKKALADAISERSKNAEEAYGSIANRKIDARSNVELLAEAVSNKAASKASALQDKGRFDTFAAQQGNLGEKFTPVPGMPRVSDRASNFPDRVLEGKSAGKEAGSIAAQRFKEEDFLRRTMDLLEDTVDDRALTPLLRRPSMKVALNDAIKGAEETGQYFPSAAGEKFSIANLQRIKQSLDDAVRDPAAFGIKATEAKEIMGTREAFVKWLSNKSPDWKAARLQYADDSRPINQMQVGQYLEDKLVGPLETGDRAAVFAGAMDNAAGTIKNSTGQSRYRELGQVLNPQQEKVANAVLSSLKDERTFNDLASKGMSATRKITGEFGQPAQGVGMVGSAVTVANAILRRVEGKGTKSTMNTLADVLQDPQRTATLMKNATPAERKSIVDALTQATTAAMGQQP